LPWHGEETTPQLPPLHTAKPRQHTVVTPSASEPVAYKTRWTRHVVATAPGVDQVSESVFVPTVEFSVVEPSGQLEQSSGLVEELSTAEPEVIIINK